MFELKRSEILKEEVKVNGEVITTMLNLTKDSREIVKTIRELQVIQNNLSKEVDLVNNLEKLGTITIKLVKMFFGENADKVLNFYSDAVNENEREISSKNTEEMLIEVVPFLFSLMPKINEFVANKKDELNKSIKGRKVI